MPWVCSDCSNPHPRMKLSMSELHYPGAMEVAMANATREKRKRKEPMSEAELNNWKARQYDGLKARVAELEMALRDARTNLTAEGHDESLRIFWALNDINCAIN